MQRTSFVVVGLAVLLIGPSAQAFSPNPACVLDAIKTNRSCKKTCNQDFLEAKDLCDSVDHACADSCRAARKACVAPIQAPVDACIDACNATRYGSRLQCRALYTTGTPERDQCIDAAQVVAFVCRDTCQENVDAAGLAQCRDTFRSCIVLCPPAN